MNVILQRGLTPLYAALESKPSEEVVRLLMEAHPDAVKEKDEVSRGTSRSNI